MTTFQQLTAKYQGPGPKDALLSYVQELEGILGNLEARYTKPLTITGPESNPHTVRAVKGLKQCIAELKALRANELKAKENQ